jgi:hypothetical protein
MWTVGHAGGCRTGNEDKKTMQFEVTNDAHILTITADPPNEAGRSGPTFANEQELHKLARVWPMKLLVGIWNHLPGVPPVRKFENRQIAIARIWRALESKHEPAGHAVGSRRTARNQIAFREGSKAAQVCSLLARPEGATLNEIRSATGWQAHTVRGFISRNVAKQGRKVRSFEKNGERVYRVKA